MRQGFFEEVPSSGDQRVFRLRWEPIQPLTEDQRRYAQFVRYLIAAGRLSELTERPGS